MWPAHWCRRLWCRIRRRHPGAQLHISHRFQLHRTALPLIWERVALNVAMLRYLRAVCVDPRRARCSTSRVAPALGHAVVAARWCLSVGHLLQPRFGSKAVASNLDRRWRVLNLPIRSVAQSVVYCNGVPTDAQCWLCARCCPQCVASVEHRGLLPAHACSQPCVELVPLPISARTHTLWRPLVADDHARGPHIVAHTQHCVH